MKCYSVSEDLNDRMDQQGSNISFISSTFQLTKLFFNQFKFYYACNELHKSVRSGDKVPASKIFKNFNTVLLRADALTGTGEKVLKLFQKLHFIDLSQLPSELSLQLSRGKSLLSLSSSSAALIDSVWALRDQVKKEQGMQSDEAKGLSLESKKGIRTVASKTMGVINHLKSSATSEGKSLITLGSSLVSSMNSIWSLSDQIEKEQGLSPGMKKEIRIVAANSVKLTLNLIQASALIFCTRANPLTLALLSTVSFGLSAVKFYQEYDGNFWGSSSHLQIKNSSHLPA